jgi:hypothetical protein
MILQLDLSLISELVWYRLVWLTVVWYRAPKHRRPSFAYARIADKQSLGFCVLRRCYLTITLLTSKIDDTQCTVPSLPMKETTQYTCYWCFWGPSSPKMPKKAEYNNNGKIYHNAPFRKVLSLGYRASFSISALEPLSCYRWLNYINVFYIIYAITVWFRTCVTCNKVAALKPTSQYQKRGVYY